MDRLLIGSLAAPWGPIRLAAGEDGLVALEQRLPEEEFATRVERRFRGVVIARDTDPSALDHPGTPALARAREAVLRFLDGDLGALGDLPLVLDDRPAWDRRVLDAVRTIPPGATASYGEVARMAGSPGAARAVGGAVGRNPIGLAIPCHRVIAGDGSLGGYGAGWWGGREAGLELKTELLAREGVVVRTRAHR